MRIDKSQMQMPGTWIKMAFTRKLFSLPLALSCIRDWFSTIFVFCLSNSQIRPVPRISKATLPAKRCTEARTCNWFAKAVVAIRPHNWFGIKTVLKYGWPTGKLLLLLLFNVRRMNMMNARCSLVESAQFAIYFFFHAAAVRSEYDGAMNKNLIEFHFIAEPPAEYRKIFTRLQPKRMIIKRASDAKRATSCHRHLWKPKWI